MATAESVKLLIPGTGYVFFADPSTEDFDISAVDFKNPDTHSGWTWLGDTSLDNPPEFSIDGGDVTFKDTWARRAVRTITAPQTLTVTLNVSNVALETIKEFAPAATVQADKSAIANSLKGVSVRKAVMIVMADGQDRAAYSFPHVDASIGFPKIDVENFLEFPLTLAVLEPSSDPAYRWYEPRRSAPASSRGRAN